jgi:hypothetical protein
MIDYSFHNQISQSTSMNKLCQVSAPSVFSPVPRWLKTAKFSRESIRQGPVLGTSGRMQRRWRGGKKPEVSGLAPRKLRRKGSPRAKCGPGAPNPPCQARCFCLGRERRPAGPGPSPTRAPCTQGPLPGPPGGRRSLPRRALPAASAWHPGPGSAAERGFGLAGSKAASSPESLSARAGPSGTSSPACPGPRGRPPCPERRWALPARHTLGSGRGRRRPQSLSSARDRGKGRAPRSWRWPWTQTGGQTRKRQTARLRADKQREDTRAASGQGRGRGGGACLPPANPGPPRWGGQSRVAT